MHVSSYLHVVTCTPACLNGGTCYKLSSYAYCHCPSGYSGSYCQNRGAHDRDMHMCMHAAIHGPFIHCNIIMFLHLRILAVTSCTPACRNGGTCRGSSYYAYCHCPSGYSGSYCQYRGRHKQEHAAMELTMAHLFTVHMFLHNYAHIYLQLPAVVLPVRMEEHAIIPLTLLTVPVPVGTQDPTARPEVHTTKNMHAAIELWHIDSLYIYMFLHLRIFAVTSCTPACQNGGTCHHSTYSSYCHCPSGYSGSYCQNRGMHKQLCMSMHVASDP